MHRFSRSVCVIFLLAGACIEPYEFTFSERSTYLVVEGSLTTLEGPHSVRLTTTRNINGDDNAYKLYVEKASVQIIDSEGNIEVLKENKPGIYETSSAFKGIEGRSYQLSIETADGRKYLSDEEEILANVAIEEIHLDYGKETYVNEENFNVTRDGFQISARLNDPGSIKNNFLFRMNITYQVFTHPELFTVFVDSIGVAGAWVIDPKDCCAYCFVSDNLPGFIVANDRNINGVANAELPLMFLPIKSRHYFDKARLEVVQYSLTDKAYLFWYAYDKLINQQGGIFDNPPSALVSNITNIEDDSEKVLGYFYASSVSSKEVFFNHKDVPRPVQYALVWNDDCRLLANSTTERPDFW